MPQTRRIALATTRGQKQAATPAVPNRMFAAATILAALNGLSRSRWLESLVEREIAKNVDKLPAELRPSKS